MKLDWNRHGIDVSKVRGGKMLCPRCSHTRKNKSDLCLSVNVAEGIWNCHNCGWSGTAKVFEKVIEKKIYTKPEPRPRAVGEKLSKWFAGRGISNETLLIAKVTESMEYIPKVQKERLCACFNYYRGDELVNIKFRDGAKNFKLSGGAELIFYNLNSILGRSEAIITEGEIDCLSLIEIGATNVVSVPNGASGGNQKLVYLDNCIDNFDGIDKITIATDGDEAGISLRKELIRRLGSDRCYIVTYPDGCKDANEVLLKYGKDALWECITKTTQPELEGVHTVDDLRAEVNNIATNGYPSVVGINGYPQLNDLIKWRGGELTVVTGIPSSGKSEWVDQIMLKLASQHNWRFGVFSPENQPTQIHIIKLIEKVAGQPLFRHGDIQPMLPSTREKVMSFLNDHFYFLAIDEIDLTIDGILAKFTEMVKRYGVNAVLIDPYNYIEYSMERGQTETQYVSLLLTKIVMFAKKYDVHVFLVAHPRKMPKDSMTKKFDVPTLYDISGSSHFYNKTYNGITVYRNEDSGVIDIHVQKVKFKFVGKKGIANFIYDIPTGRYTELGGKFIGELGYLDKDDNQEYENNTKKIFSRKQVEQIIPSDDLDEDGNPYPF